MATMKKGRISKDEEKFVGENIDLGYEALANKMDRDPSSLLSFIKKKVAKGDLPEPSWLQGRQQPTEQAEFELQSRPYFAELENQFTEKELRLFKHYWTRITTQFKDDVLPTEEMQVVDLVKLDLLMNRSLSNNKGNMEQIESFEALIQVERQRDPDQQDRDNIFNLERQIAALKASQESLNKDYRELQTKKNSMLKEMKATREQRVKRLEDSKQNFTSWLSHLMSNPEIARNYGMEMEKMRLAMNVEKERLSKYHKYQDQMVDQPFLTPDTVQD